MSETEEKARTPRGKMLSVPLLIAGFIFLANPVPLLLDVLPDAIGCLLLMLAVRGAVNCHSDFRDFRTTVKKYLIVELVKIPAFIVMLSVFRGHASERAIVPVFTLAFSIAEATHLVPMVRDFFCAFYRLGERFGCSAAITPTGRTLRIDPQNLEKLTLTFFIARCVVSTLPEMALVPLQDANGGRDWNAAYPVLAALGCFLMLIFAVVFLAYLIHYLRSVGRDPDLMGNLLAAYTRNERGVKRTQFNLLRAGVIFFLIGGIFLFDFSLDGVNILPDYIAAVCFLLSVFFLSRLSDGTKPLAVVTVLFFIATVAQAIAESSFYSHYTLSSIEKNPNAAAAYADILLFATFAGILLVLVFILFFRTWKKIVLRYTGVAQEGCKHFTLETAIKAELTKKSRWVAILGVLVALTSLFWEYTFSVTQNVRTSAVTALGYVTLPVFDWFIYVKMIVFVIWFCFSLHTFFRIEEESEVNLIEE